MEIKIVKDKISLEEVKKMASENFGDMIKAVVDLKKEIIALGGELHADAEQVLLDDNSRQPDLWGINIYPDNVEEERIEFTSLINIRPQIGNRSVNIEIAEVKDKILKIIDKLII